MSGKLNLTFFVLFFVLLLNLPSHADAKKITLGKITHSVREEYIRSAQVWHQVDVPNMDVMAGPQNDISVPPFSEVTCSYVEPKEPQSGAVPKFKCKLPSGQVVRIKYGGETRVDREVFSKLAATRLFWALGFYADEDYPVKIHCLGCPEKNPWHPGKDEQRVERMIDPALMERDFPGIIIEESPDQGWNWAELDKVDEAHGGAPRPQIDALKLLAVFVQHSDNKADNQRLACYPDEIRDPAGKGIGFCDHPVMMVADLGSTFGAGDSMVMQKMDLEGWSKTDIWSSVQENAYFMKNHKKVCFGNLTNSITAGDVGLRDPLISEAGRKFLADLLNQLSDKQIEDIFRVARADQVPHLIHENGTQAIASLDDWVNAFKKKRDEISQRQCAIIVEESK